jgi:hypothetical protein
MNLDFRRQRVHNYLELVKRWQRLARRARLELKSFCRVSEFDLVYIKSPALTSEKGVYLSAGIHGDEPAATEGLCLWAESNLPILRQLPLLLFPCLNPWGLVNNRRTDEQGRDLNRWYHLDEPETIQQQKAIIGPYRFRLGMCLHEDYDAQGVYCYEIRKSLSPLGQELLAAAGYYVPVDLRRTIEGRRAAQGWIGRRKIRPRFPFKAESMFLAESHSDRNITFETPSEYDLIARVNAHVAVIQRAVELVMSTELPGRNSERKASRQKAITPG